MRDRFTMLCVQHAHRRDSCHYQRQHSSHAVYRAPVDDHSEEEDDGVLDTKNIDPRILAALQGKLAGMAGASSGYIEE